MRYQTNFGTFELVDNWADVPAEWVAGPIAGIGTDRQDHIYVLTRGTPSILIFNKDGTCLKCWDDTIFARPHGICIADGKATYVVDDAAHAAYQFDTDLKLVSVFGRKDVPSDTGCINKNYRTITHGGEPFHYPTDVACDEDGNLYFSDGYGNARVHCFSPDGKLLYSWGEPGTEPGEFQLPHGILYHNGLLYVADRQNNRVQIFDCKGTPRGILDDLIRPANICMGPDNNFYVAECVHCAAFDRSPSRVSVFTQEGKLLGRLETGCGDQPATKYHTAHSIAVDSDGSIYIGEVGKGFPSNYSGLQKFQRIK